MKTTSVALALIMLLAAGCSDRSESVPTASSNEPAVAQSSMSPEQLGELGAQIKKNPNDAQRLLSEKGLTEESFEAAIRKVSEDPAASRRYAAAYKQAS